MSKTLASIKAETLNAHNGVIRYFENPTRFLVENNLIVETGNGLFVLKGLLVDLIRKVDSILVRIAEETGATEWDVPNILSWEVAQKSRYLNSFFHQGAVIRKNNIDQPSDIGGGDVIGLASPAACHHIFASVSGKHLQQNTMVTVKARCTRFEEGELNDLSRLINFTMREIVGLGSGDYCQKNQSGHQELVLAFLKEKLDISFELRTASDPFFGVDSEFNKKAQLLLQSKHEIVAHLPFRQEGVAIASFNQHGKLFFERFGIQGEKGITNSFCTAFGLERIVFTIISQKGTDFSDLYYRRLLSD